MTKIELAREYCLKYEGKDKRWIARKLTQDYPELWGAGERAIDNARHAVRSVKGKAGDRCRKEREWDQVMWEDRSKRPYILLIDIETCPSEGYFWGIWNQNIAIDQIRRDWTMLCWSAKWLFDDKVMSDQLTPNEAIERDDARITKSIWLLIDKADVIIAHNGRRFDLRKLNQRFLIHGLNPPMPYQVVDTLEVAKKVFGFTSNKLDFINRLLGIRRKIHTDFELWLNCMDGDQVALDEMAEYNRNDVAILEETYVKLRPWIKSHPNIGLYAETVNECCGNCGCPDLDFPEGQFYFTPLGKYSSGRCRNCGAIVRSRVSALSKDDRKNLLSTTAR